jgi:hypothetical protein
MGKGRYDEIGSNVQDSQSLAKFTITLIISQVINQI